MCNNKQFPDISFYLEGIWALKKSQIVKSVFASFLYKENTRKFLPWLQYAEVDPREAQKAFFYGFKGIPGFREDFIGSVSPRRCILKKNEG